MATAATMIDVISVREAAELIGCTVGRVRQLLIDEELRGWKLNERAWMVDKQDARRVARNPSEIGRPRSGGA